VEIGLFDGVRTGLVRVVTDKGIFLLMIFQTLLIKNANTSEKTNLSNLENLVISQNFTS